MDQISTVAAFYSPCGAPTALYSVSFAVFLGFGLCTREIQGNVQDSTNIWRIHSNKRSDQKSL